MAQLLTILAIGAALAELFLRFAVLLQRIFSNETQLNRELLIDPIVPQKKEPESPQKTVSPKKHKIQNENQTLPTESDKPLKTEDGQTDRQDGLISDRNPYELPKKEAQSPRQPQKVIKQHINPNQDFSGPRSPRFAPRHIVGHPAQYSRYIPGVSGVGVSNQMPIQRSSISPGPRHSDPVVARLPSPSRVPPQFNSIPIQQAVPAYAKNSTPVRQNNEGFANRNSYPGDPKHHQDSFNLRLVQQPQNTSEFPQPQPHYYQPNFNGNPQSPGRSPGRALVQTTTVIRRMG